MSILFGISYGVLWVLVVLQGLVLLGLLRLVHRLQQEGPAARPASDGESLLGERAPAFSVVDVRGTPVTSDDLAGRMTALLFVSPKCSSCVVTLEELEALKGKVEGSIVVVCLAGAGECERLIDEYGLTVPVISDPEEGLRELFDVSAPPTAVIISEGGHVLHYGHPSRDENLEQMLHDQDPVQVGGVHPDGA